MEKVFPAGALIKRELLSNLRRAQSLVIVLVFVIILSIVIMAMWPRDQMYMYGVAGMSEGMVKGIIIMLLLAAGLILPGLAASSIVGEKEQETFDLLHMTLIGPRGVVLGKFVNVVGFFLLMAIAALPVVGVVFFLVGVDWIDVLRSFLLVLAYTFTFAMIGIFASTLFKRATAAILGSYLFILINMLGPMLGILMLHEYFNINSISHSFLEWVAFITTPAPIFDSGPSRYVLYYAVGYQILWSLVLFKAASFVLGRPPREDKVEQKKPIDDPTLLDLRRKKFPYYLIDPRRRKKIIEDNRNPMMVKEIRWGLWGKSASVVRLFYVSVIAFLVIGFFTPIPVIIISLLFAPALVANSFTKEYELGNFDMLRMTLLKPSQIVLGKLWAAIISILPLALAALLAGVVPLFFDVLGANKYFIFTGGYLMYLAYLAVSITAGLYASLIARKTSTSVVLSYLFCTGVFLDIPFLFVFLHEFDILRFPSHREMNIFIPIAAFEDSMRGFYSGHRLYASQESSYFYESLLLYGIYAVSFVLVSIYYFKKYRMQDN